METVRWLPDFPGFSKEKRLLGGGIFHHDLKVAPAYFDAVVDGRKRFELRNNDRGFQLGDVLRLHEHHPEMGFSGRWYEAQVTYITDFPTALRPGYVCMSIQVLGGVLRYNRAGSNALQTAGVANETSRVQ